ncbi:MAG: OB-fold nucleic acid binding domain-containing protein [Promethearchaeota archaeon]
MDLEETIQKICNKAKLSREDLEKKVKTQIEELSGLIDEEGALLIVAKNYGIDLKENQEAAKSETDLLIKDLKPRINASIVGRITDINDIRTFTRKDGGQGSLLTFIIADKSGMIRCLAWGEPHTQIVNEQNFTTGEIIRVINGYVKEGRSGTLEFNIGARSRLQLQPDEVDLSNIPENIDQSSKITPLNELSLSSLNFTIEGYVSNIFQPKTFKRKNGTEGVRASLSITDRQETVFITFWGDHCDKIKNIQVGQKINITKLTPKKNYRDPNKIDLTATHSTSIKILEDSNETNIPLSSNGITPTQYPNDQLLTIKDLVGKGGFASIEGIIQEIEDIKSISTRSGTNTNLQKLILADETGAIRINIWGDLVNSELKVGDVLRFEGIMGQINNYSKRMEGTLTRNGKIVAIEKEIHTTQTLPNNDDFRRGNNYNTDLENVYENNRKNLKEISKNDFYQFKGTIIKELSRITTYTACSKCNRKIDNCRCEIPGESTDRMILNLILDDGSATIRGTLMGDNAEKFLGESTEKIVNMKESGEIQSYLAQKNLEIIGKEYIFRGKAKYSNYSESYEVNINAFEELDPEKEAARLLSIIEG